MQRDGRLIGLYGGTFDPVHRGHLCVAEAALAALGLQHVTFIPAGDPPLRDAPGASAGDRLAMLRLALAGRSGLRVDPQELHRPGRSYTIDTLLAWRAAHGADQPLAWLVGADAAARLDQWQRWRELPDVAHLILVERPDAQQEAHWSAGLREFVRAHLVTSIAELHARPAGGVFQFVGPRVDVSATAVRTLCAAHESAANLLSTEVWAYIQRRRLYGWR